LVSKRVGLWYSFVIALAFWAIVRNYLGDVVAIGIGVFIFVVSLAYFNDKLEVIVQYVFRR
jgi:hypothetical protein